MTATKKISTGLLVGLLALGTVGIGGTPAFATDGSPDSAVTSTSSTTSDATYDLIFDPDNPGKATMSANKATFVERGDNISVIDDSGKNLGELPKEAETAEGDPLNVSYTLVSDTKLEVTYSAPQSGASQGAALRAAGVTWQCGLSYATYIASTGSLIAAPFTGGTSAVVGAGILWAANGVLTYDACK